MIRYFQVGEEGKWQPMQDVGPDRLFWKLWEQGASRYSILAVNREVTDDIGEETDELRYAGPWYADIDCSDLNEAIASAKELVQKLLDLRVPEQAIEVYCSGSKGFHILVSPRVFRPKSDRPVKKLPYVYREIARSLFVIGLDFAVYSGGKGRMFRPPGAPRPDGKARTRIEIEALMGCTPELYLHWVSGGYEQKAWPIYDGEVVETMAIRYQEAMRKVKAKETEEKNPVTTEELRQFSETPPACIELLCEGQAKKTANFNQIAMQAGIYLARSGAYDGLANTIIDRIAVAYESNSYKTERDRQVQLKAQRAYMTARSKYKFGCHAMRGMVGNQPCQSCPLKEASGVNGTEPDEVFQLLVEEQDGGYIRLTEDGIAGRGFSNFILKPREAFYHSDTPNMAPKRKQLVADLVVKGHSVGDVEVTDQMFRSKSEMIKALEGTPAIFTGTDHEAQQLKEVMFKNHEPEETILVYAAGIHPTYVSDGKWKLTYVEPGWSIDQFFSQGTHSLRAEVKGKPQLKNVPDISDTDKPHLEVVLRNLMQINSLQVMAMVFGWHMAAHIKSHIFTATQGFPLINLWGAAGCGKTETAKMMSWLNGGVYGGGDANDIITATLGTKLPLIEHVANMITIPRIVEEYNPHMFPSKALFHFVTEVLKGAYNNGSIPRGRLTSNAESKNEINASSTDTKVRSPIILCSEQHPETASLQERTLSVHMSKNSRAGRTSQFLYVRKHRRDVLKIARYLTMAALKTRIADVHALMEHYDSVLPQDLSERPRICFSAVYAGLDFFRHSIISDEGLGLSGLMPDYLELRSALDSYLLHHKDTIIRAKSRTEADNFLSALAEMASVSIQDPTVRFQILNGEHFLVNNGKLHLDILMCMHKYKTFMREEGAAPVYKRMSQAVADLREEEYWITGNGQAPASTTTRLVPVLDMAKMQDKGIDVTLFTGQ